MFYLQTGQSHQGAWLSRRCSQAKRDWNDGSQTGSPSLASDFPGSSSREGQVLRRLLGYVKERREIIIHSRDQPVNNKISPCSNEHVSQLFCVDE